MVGKLFQVIFSLKSRTRLKEISEYHKENVSKEVSKKVRQKIVAEASKLKELPESKPILPGTENMDYEVRYTKAWSFKIIFRVFNPKNIVRILTIRHDKEAPEDILKDID